jgi:hypothetical protein
LNRKHNFIAAPHQLSLNQHRTKSFQNQDFEGGASMKFSSLFLASLIFVGNIQADPLDREKLVAKYPGLEQGSGRPENKQILCPFHRLLERAGVYDEEIGYGGELLVNIVTMTSKAKEFGCKILACGPVATAVSAGQVATESTSVGKVDIAALHRSLGISHECAFTWAKGGGMVSDAQRDTNLARLKALADADGRLTLGDLQNVKNQICDEQDVVHTVPGQTEVFLIWSFLGGTDRGYIDYDDVDRFFHAELPKFVSEPTSL